MTLSPPACAVYRRVHHVAFGQGLVAKAVEYLPTDHFRQVRRIHFDRLLVAKRLVGLGHGLLIGGSGEVFVPEHFLQHPVAACNGAPRVVDRVDD